MNDSLTTIADDPAGVWAAGIGTAGVFALLIVVVWQIAVTWRSRMLAAREEEYRRLSAKYADLLEDNTEILRRWTDELGETRAAVASMERMMRELD
ncbi:hypothetical protein [Streptomyces marincola]|uniref:Death domain-containing protein n=1 Tax=Streptomyces marincola TaxID=2878388 RepID=A0A1W7CXD0_9ACTN|nr:hypothetical protein [Streptomyces marincola]ARQ69385.1 hypothetical protein CAG99_11345 [Streptomyces marincola]